MSVKCEAASIGPGHDRHPLIRDPSVDRLADVATSFASGDTIISDAQRLRHDTDHFKKGVGKRVVWV
jgi:hypothetical protein